MEKFIFSKRHYEHFAQHAAQVNSIMYTNHLVSAFKGQGNFDELKFRDYVAKWTVRRMMGVKP